MVRWWPQLLLGYFFVALHLVRTASACASASDKHTTMVEQKAAVAMMEIEQSELDRVSEAFGYNLISTSRRAQRRHSPPMAAPPQPTLGVLSAAADPSLDSHAQSSVLYSQMLHSRRLTGGYASSNFAAVLKPPGDAAEFTAVLKFSYAAMPREEIEHQLTVLRALEQHGFATNYLLPKLAAASDAGLCDRYLVTAEDGGGPWVILVTFCAGTAGDKMLAAAAAPVERAMLESLGASLAQLHAIPWEA